VKLTLVIILSGYHGYLIRLAKEFKRGERKHADKFYRMINEIPFLLLIIIVVMVVVKPF
jgi:putative membrane protein